MHKQTFTSVINGTKIDVVDPLTADLLSKNEKKEIIQKEIIRDKRKSGKTPPADNEQEIS